MAIHPSIALQGSQVDLKKGFEGIPVRISLQLAMTVIEKKPRTKKKTLSGENCPGNLNDLIVQAII